jgi:hypothetical protein
MKQKVDFKIDPYGVDFTWCQNLRVKQYIISYTIVVGCAFKSDLSLIKLQYKSKFLNDSIILYFYSTE